MVAPFPPAPSISLPRLWGWLGGCQPPLPLGVVVVGWVGARAIYRGQSGKSMHSCACINICFHVCVYACMHPCMQACRPKQIR